MNQTAEQAELLAEPPALPGRWTICAMLFMAAIITSWTASRPPMPSVWSSQAVLLTVQVAAWLALGKGGMLRHNPAVRGRR